MSKALDSAIKVLKKYVYWLVQFGTLFFVVYFIYLAFKTETGNGNGFLHLSQFFKSVFTVVGFVGILAVISVVAYFVGVNVAGEEESTTQEKDNQ